MTLRKHDLEIVVTAGLAIYMAYIGFNGPWTPLHIAGAVLLVIGFIGWLTARLQIREFFTPRGEARGLVTTGIYSKIRNPIYFFGLVFFVGIALYLPVRWWVLLAKESKVTVGGETKVVVASPRCSQTERPEYIANLEGRLSEYELRINKVFLECADTSIRVDQLEESINDFKQAALALHREHMDGLVSGLDFADLFQPHAYRKLPKGTPIGFGINGFSIEHDQEKLKQHEEEMRVRIQQIESTVMHKKCGSFGGQYEYFIKALHSGERRPSFNCPHCNAPNVIPAKVLRFRKIGDAEWTTVED